MSCTWMSYFSRGHVMYTKSYHFNTLKKSENAAHFFEGYKNVAHYFEDYDFNFIWFADSYLGWIQDLVFGIRIWF